MQSEQVLNRFQKAAFDYFDRESHPVTGLVKDSSSIGAAASIAGSGMALSAYAVAAERGFLSRGEAARRTLVALRFLDGSRSKNGFFFLGYVEHLA